MQFELNAASYSITGVLDTRLRIYGVSPNKVAHVRTIASGLNGDQNWSKEGWKGQWKQVIVIPVHKFTSLNMFNLLNM